MFFKNDYFVSVFVASSTFFFSSRWLCLSRPLEQEENRIKRRKKIESFFSYISLPFDVVSKERVSRASTTLVAHSRHYTHRQTAADSLLYSTLLYYCTRLNKEKSVRIKWMLLLLLFKTWQHLHLSSSSLLLLTSSPLLSLSLSHTLSHHLLHQTHSPSRSYSRSICCCCCCCTQHHCYHPEVESSRVRE